MINMKILSVVTPPSIYHSCSTQKTFCKGNLTGEEKLFLAMNMKNCGRRNVSKNREIKDSDKYVTLDISFKNGSLEKMKITSSESKEKLEISGKGLITYLGFKAKVRSNKYKKARYAIGNVSKKYISKIIREFEKLPYESYKKKSPKHEPTDNYFYQERQLAKCMMRYDDLNSHGYPVTP